MDDSMRPAGVSCWNWYDPRYEDCDLYRNCIVAACNAGHHDPSGSGGVAEGMYAARGGKILSYNEVAAKKRAAAKARRLEESSTRLGRETEKEKGGNL